MYVQTVEYEYVRLKARFDVIESILIHLSYIKGRHKWVL